MASSAILWAYLVAYISISDTSSRLLLSYIENGVLSTVRQLQIFEIEKVNVVYVESKKWFC